MTYAFISYSRSDSEYVSKLVEKLRAEGFDIWIDQRINTGTKWFQEIEKAILGCGAFVVVMTPDSYESEWVQKEVIIALDEHKSIFPLLLDGRRFGILADVQFNNVSDGSLPQTSFFDDLARVIPRKKSSPAPTALQEMKPPAAPLPYIPGNPLNVDSEVRRAGLEQKITERLKALLHNPRLGLFSQFSSDVHCIIGRVYVYANVVDLVASITFSSLDANVMVPLPSWELRNIASDPELAAYVEGVATPANEFCQRLWLWRDYESNLEVVARELIAVNEKLGFSLDDITIECVGL